MLITGGAGRLSHVLAPAFVGRGWEVHAPGRAELDITCPLQVRKALSRWRPTALVNLAAWTDLGRCETDPDQAFEVNGLAVGTLMEQSAKLGVHLCHISTDYVFDGRQRTPYREIDAPNPLSAYGASKLEGERLLAPEATLVRVGWISSPFGRSFVRTVLRQARWGDGRELRYVTDEVGSPTVAGDAARSIIALVERRHAGTIHVANEGSASRFQVACRVMAAAGHDLGRVGAVRTAELLPPFPGTRPQYSALDTSNLQAMGLGNPPWEQAVDQLVQQLIQHAH